MWLRCCDLLKKTILISFALICTYLSFKLLLYHYSLITFPWPIQLRETANLLSTEMFMKGGNPYLIKNQPVYTNVYGLFYNVVVSPVAVLFGSTLTVHKAVAGFFTLCSCLGVFILLRKESVHSLLAWGGALIVYETLLFSKTSLAEPDSLGVLLYLLSIVVPAVYRYSSRSLVFSILAGLAAFYTKLYFVLGVPCVGLYLFLFISRKKGLAYVCGFLLLLASSTVIMQNLFESYFYNTFLTHFNVVNNNISWMIEQWQVFARFYSGIIVAVIALGGISLFRSQGASPISSATQPVARSLTGERISLPLFAAFCVSFLFTIKLGTHNGAYMTYLYQLVTPLLVLFLFPWFTRQWRADYIVLPLVGANLIVASLGYKDINTDFREHDKGDWQKALVYVASHRNILNSAAVAPLIYAQGGQVYNSGQSEYFACSFTKPPPVSILFPDLDRVREQDRSYRMKVSSGLAARSFDLLMLDRSCYQWFAPGDLIFKNYLHRDVLTLYMPHTRYTVEVDVWEPIK